MKAFADFIKVLFQSLFHQIDLFPGYCATAVTIPVFHSIYFSVFYRAKSYLKENWTSETRPVVRDVAASAVTGLIANTVTNPFWVVRTRIQSQFLHREEKVPKYTGLLPGLSQMYKEVRDFRIFAVTYCALGRV